MKRLHVKAYTPNMSSHNFLESNFAHTWYNYNDILNLVIIRFDTAKFINSEVNMTHIIRVPA